MSFLRRLPLRPTVLVIVLVVALLHGAVLWWAQSLWQPQSRIQLMSEPVYARLIQPKEPAALPRPRAGQKTAAEQPRAAVRNTDAIATRPLPKTEPKTPPPPPKPQAPPVAPPAAATAKKIQIPPPPASKPLFAALGDDEIAALPESPPEETEPFADDSASPSSPTPQPSPSPAPGTPSSTPVPTLLADAATDVANTGGEASNSPANGGATSTGSAAVYQDWPQDTRINVKISGYYRGKVTGSGSVTWQRAQDQNQYQARVAVSFGLGGFTMTSQGAVTEAGLTPKIFEESIVGSLRSARFEDDAITIGSGKRIPRAGLPGGLGAGSFQDSASQFVELAWRFATGRATLAPGSTVSYWLGRPEGLYQYIYDISGPEPMDLPKLGRVNTWHLMPRPIPGLKPDAIYGEIWIAPSLQYLPVKIRMRNTQGVYLDLLVDTVEQSESAAKK